MCETDKPTINNRKRYTGKLKKLTKRLYYAKAYGTNAGRSRQPQGYIFSIHCSSESSILFRMNTLHTLPGLDRTKTQVGYVGQGQGGNG